MKKYLYIYNIAFLLIGNILFSNIHYLTEHAHSDDADECVECLYFENNSNYTSCEDELIFLDNNITTVLLNDLDCIESKINKKFHSRAPPVLQ